MLHHLRYPPRDTARPSTPHPLIVALHGAGEVGRDLDRVRRQGLPARAERGPGLRHWADPVKPWQDRLTPERELWQRHAVAS